MAAYQIFGGEPLQGSIHIQGSKNAALPVIAASLLHRGTTILYGCPDISDVHCMINILRSLGCIVEWEKEKLLIDASKVLVRELSGDCIAGMRSSILFLGALIGRCRELVLDYPGGCCIGKRPIDMHLNALECMGVHIDVLEEGICCSCSRLKGTSVHLPYPSVGATENIMMAAVLADGMTWINNAALEPEVCELACFLKQMGAVIYGDGTKCIRILGGCTLKDCEYHIMGDRIVAGTYLLGAAGTGGFVEVRGVYHEYLRPILHICEAMGCKISEDASAICLKAPECLKSVDDIHTGPYPGVPTDLQSLLMAVLTKAKGETWIYEHVFENRFGTARELIQMGANIHIYHRHVHICGVHALKGCSVNAGDLRGGAALILAGLMAEGETIVENSYYVERGYQNICKDLRELGADITIINNKE